MKDRRRRLVVDKQLQSKIIVAASWPAALCLAVTVVLLGAFCAKVTHQMMEADLSLDGVLTLLIMALVFMVVSTAYFLFNCLKVSHRVAGPIFRLNDTLRQVREGNYEQRARCRKDDFLLNFVDELNEFLDWVEPHLPPVATETADETAGETTPAQAAADAEPETASSAAERVPTTVPDSVEALVDPVVSGTANGVRDN